MKYVVLLAGGLLLFGATASAQEEAEAASEPEAAAEEAPAEAEAPPEEEKKSVYYKKVQGWLWIEGFVGPTSYDPDQYGTIGGIAPAPKVKGPEGGLSILLGLGGFGIGWFYRQAGYDTYKLMKTGLEMQGTFRFVPYVHPMVRIDIGYARMFSGNPFGITNFDSDGVSFTLGAGLRIPIIRWMSFAASFDWSAIGLLVRGTGFGGENVSSWIGGQQLGGTFSLTFHFIGVRKN